MQALEDLREGLALLEVQAAVVGGTRSGGATGPHQIEVGNERGIGRTHRPTGADGQRRVQLTFDLPKVEAHGLRVTGKAQGDGGGQRMRSKQSARCFLVMRFSSEGLAGAAILFSGTRLSEWPDRAISPSPESCRAQNYLTGSNPLTIRL
ncbi:hypothetical protein FQZ97_814390 [compost metagenome]